MILRSLAVLLFTLLAPLAADEAPAHPLLIVEVRVAKPQAGLAEDLVLRARAMAGVVNAGVTRERPDLGRPATSRRRPATVQCSTEGPNPRSMRVTPFTVSPELLAIEGIQIERGRLSSARDNKESSLIVLIERSVAESLWPGKNPLGQRLTFGSSRNAPLSRLFAVVGIVMNGRRAGLLRGDQPMVFLTFAQAPPPERFSLVVRTVLEPEAESRRIVARVCGYGADLLCRPVPQS